MQSLGLLGLVFDNGFSVTPLLGHLGCLASRWSVPAVLLANWLSHPVSAHCIVGVYLSYFSLNFNLTIAGCCRIILGPEDGSSMAEKVSGEYYTEQKAGALWRAVYCQ